MSKEYYNGTLFTAIVNGKQFKFTCFGQDTAHGFRHVCYEGIIAYPYKGLKPIAKCLYLNRTWERWQYQSVLNAAIDNLLKNKTINKTTHDELIDTLIERNGGVSEVRYIRHLLEDKI